MAENILCAGVTYPVPEAVEAEGRKAVEAWHLAQPWYAESVRPAPQVSAPIVELDHQTEEG